MSGGFLLGLGAVVAVAVLITLWPPREQERSDERLAADAAVWEAIARRDLYSVQSKLAERN